MTRRRSATRIAPRITPLTPEQSALVERHRALACMEARRASIKIAALDYEDALADASLGLMGAARVYDVTRGTTFATCACPRIRGAIIDGLRDRLGSRRFLEWERERVQAEARVTQRTGHAPTDAEFAAELQLDVATYRERRLHWHQVESIAGAPVGHLSIDDAEQEPDHLLRSQPDARRADDDLLAAERTTQLMRALQTLTPLEQHVLRAYYYEDVKLHVIGAELGLTESRISQVRAVALAKLRATISADGRILAVA